VSVPSLAAFLGAGLVQVSGARSLARRVAFAAVAAGIAASPLLLPAPALAAGGAVYERAPLVTGQPAPDAEARIDPKTMGKLIDGSAPFVAAALRHGLDPERFLTISLVTRQLRDEPAELARLRLAPILGRKGELGRMADPMAARWLDLVERHGRDLGAASGLDALSAAQSIEAGKRRKPIVEAVMRRLVEMRGDADFEAEILAREYVATRDALPDGFDRVPESHAYVALAFGTERLFDLAKAVELAHGRRGKGREVPAHRILGVPADANGLLSLANAKGGSDPLNPSDFVDGLDIVVGKMREIARAVLERTQAAAPSAPGNSGLA
jgi:hypothetical protein